MRASDARRVDALRRYYMFYTLALIYADSAMLAFARRRRCENARVSKHCLIFFSSRRLRRRAAFQRCHLRLLPTRARSAATLHRRRYHAPAIFASPL